LRGLAALEDTQVLPQARALAANRDADIKLRVAAVRLLARAGGAPDVAVLTTMLSQEPSSSALALEVVAALGALRAVDAFDALVDGFSDPAPAMRAASLAAAARVDPETFLLVLSGLGRDRDWTVRAALATVLGTLPAERVTPALLDLAADDDARVHGAALRALAALKVPDLAERVTAALNAADFAVRATAAELMGELKPDGGLALLAAAYARGDSDSTYAARLSAIEAASAYGPAAVDTLRRALSDREWPIRIRAAALLREAGVADAQPDRPAPLRQPVSFFESDALLHPAYSPRAFIETRRGVIEVQLELVDAPLTVATFIEQARGGLFNGLRVHRLVPAFVIQTGDPRGDGTGGPGYTQRDELNPAPYLRGTVGMALGGAETAGSQWFITTSPQPHLDAKYTAFGRVVGGWDVLDRVAVDDVIERVRIWDGIDLR
jgi:cyclophilin family peptidyl-prolyl cis-trans isomerase/HEAT repeat protein